MKFSGKENQVNPFPAMACCRCWEKVRFVPAAVLLLAAGLKAYQLATVPSLGEGFLHNRWFNIFVVEFELLFALWLCFGQLPKLTRLASILLFSVFTAVSFYKAVSGEASCGCFGSITVNPWHTMTLDLVIVALLILCKPKCNSCFWLRYIAGCFCVWLIVAIPTLLFMTGIETATLDKSGTLSNNAHNVTLTPSDWIGKRFPLLPFLNENTAQRIESGHQTVILFRFDCEECKTVINSLADKEGYIFVAMPSGNEKHFSLEQYVTLPSDREWWIVPPVIIELKNGIVEKVR